MKTQFLPAAAVALLTLACDTPAPLASPSFAAGGIGRPSVLVNPNSSDNGTAKTIQGGIDMVASGGKVLVVPGTYNEAIVIDKGLTLEALGGESRPVVVAAPEAPFAAIEIATTEPVIIRGLTVHARRSAISGIPGQSEDVTVERTTVLAIDPPLGVAVFLIDVVGDAPMPRRGRLVVRESFVDGSISFERTQAPPFPQVFGIRAGGDIDAWIEGNVIRRTGGACVIVQTRQDLGGSLEADIVRNVFDECHAGRAGALIAGPPILRNPPLPAVTATGTVNIVGNTIRNSRGSCLVPNAIYYELYTGRIERNQISISCRSVPLQPIASCHRPSGSGACVACRRQLPPCASTTSSGTRRPGCASRATSARRWSRAAIGGARRPARRAPGPALATRSWSRPVLRRHGSPRSPRRPSRRLVRRRADRR